MKYLHLLIYFLAIGCSTSELATKPKKPETQHEANLFIRHGSLTASEFEQYAFQKGNLFFECGEVRGEKKFVVGDSLTSLNEIDLRHLNFLLDQVSLTTAKLSENSNIHSRDPGIIQMTIIDSKKSREITVSLDALKHAKGGLEAVLLEISERIRGLNNVDACGNKYFYGLRKILPGEISIQP